MTKLILQDSRIMNMILKALIGQEAENRYVSTSCEGIYGRHEDILYTPIVSPTDALPPVIVEVQNIVDKLFVRRLMKCCGDIIDKYHVEPIALTICLHGVRKDISNMFSATSKAPYLKELPSDCWAQAHYFMSEATISDYLQTPLPPMVALGYVLAKQKVSLLDMEHREDPTVQMLYDIAKVTLDHELHDEEKTVEVLLNVCKHNHDQYKRILEAMKEDGTDSKRARTYANDGLLYTETFIRKYSQQPSISSTPEAKKTDMEWVKDFVQEYKKANKRMDWQTCFTMGRSADYFKAYANAKSLQSSFNRSKSKK